MTNEQQVCTFQIAGHWYGLDVTRVQEVSLPQALTSVPLSHPAVSGLMNLRGLIVTAIDLRRRLDLPDRDTNAACVYVVIETIDGAVCLIADELGDVLTLSKQEFESPPDTLRKAARNLTVGVYKLPDRLLVLLDPDRLVELS
jgi:purine-binding chemotaxis protein CheW